MPVSTPNRFDATQHIDLRSTDIQDLLGRPPANLIRWGNTVFLCILLALLALSWFIRYPEIIAVPFRLTSEAAPKPVIAKIGGRLVRLFVKENQQVVENQSLAYIESTASHAEVLALEQALISVDSLMQQGNYQALGQFEQAQFRNLGDIQPHFQSFMQVFSQAKTLFTDGFYLRKKAFLQQDAEDLKRIRFRLMEQLSLSQQELHLASKEWEVQQKLYQQKVIPSLEYNREEAKFLAKKQPVNQLEMSLTSNLTQETAKQKEGMELEQQATELKAHFAQSLQTLLSTIAQWKSQYIVAAPQAGQVLFASLWQEQQTLKPNETLFFVGTASQQVLGEMRVVQPNSGKVNVGQRVLIKFQSYPFEQFGLVEGSIQSISSVSSADSSFRAVVKLPKGLKTNTSQSIPFKNGLNATGEIITEDLTLLQRFYYNLTKKLNTL